MAPEVDVASVFVQQVSDYQEYSGRFEAVEKVDVRSQVSGTIVAVHFKDGALVKTGDRLFTIDPQPFEAALSKAKGQLTAAQARKGYADSDRERAQRLIANGGIAKHDFDQKKNDAKEGDADVKRAQAAVDTARINLAYTDIRSPVSGRVSRAEITVGNTVSVGIGAPALTTVVSLSLICSGQKTRCRPAIGQQLPKEITLPVRRPTISARGPRCSSHSQG
ncbi:efflux RND transporter periplasmic adaptor subunit [Pseudomonas tolaasii]|uniref:efflux RND transporter periplasmic adaptor subunit n=1 Tax=Pseudomonas tolaasii TaxID=29442 RepID=UPI0027E5863A|nr:efflux RND transporter periplasmic adaptor subunit [Pseudomonas tolaasii]